MGCLFGKILKCLRKPVKKGEFLLSRLSFFGLIFFGIHAFFMNYL